MSKDDDRFDVRVFSFRPSDPGVHKLQQMGSSKICVRRRLGESLVRKQTHQITSTLELLQRLTSA